MKHLYLRALRQPPSPKPTVEPELGWRWASLNILIATTFLIGWSSPGSGSFATPINIILIMTWLLIIVWNLPEEYR